MKKFTMILLLALSSFSGSILAQQTVAQKTQLTFESDNTAANLLELYTSEGCYSCPPADNWIRQLKNDERLWKEIIPVSFHVDYWDYIGWKDKYASADFSRRQRHYAAVGGARSVYTPGFFLNGKEWRGFFKKQNLPDKKRQSPGTLKASIKDGIVEIQFIPELISSHYDINIAVLGFNLTNVIHDGENEGKTLHHDFVALGHTTKPLIKVGKTFQIKTNLPDHNYQDNKLGFAAWVSEQGNPTPIQAVGGWLD